MHIIHITGLSGSGKSTLGERIRKHKKIFIIDTDIVDDKNRSDILTNKKITTEKQKDAFFEAVEKRDISDFYELIKTKRGADILIVGMIIDMPAVLKLLKKNKIEYTFTGYYIDVPAEQIFRQVNLRHLDLISKHTDAIKKSLKNCSTFDDAARMGINLGVKYKIRGRFPIHIDNIQTNIKKQKIWARENRYKIMHPDDIFKTILQIRM